MAQTSMSHKPNNHDLEELLLKSGQTPSNGTIDIQENDVQDLPPLPASGSGFDMRKLNDGIVWLSAKGAGALATTVFAGLPGVNMIGDTVGTLLKQFLDTTPDNNTIINEKLDAIEHKLEEIAKQINHDTVATSVASDLKIVHSHAAQIDEWWRVLRTAYRNKDRSNFAETIAVIGSKATTGVSSMLAAVQNLLVGEGPPVEIKTHEGDPLTGKLLIRIREIHSRRLKDVDRDLDYGLISYQEDMQKWAKYVQDIQSKGSALMILYEMHLYLKGTDYLGQQETPLEIIGLRLRDIRSDDDLRVQAYKQVLFNATLNYESSRILLRAARHELKQPLQLYTLKVESSDESQKYLEMSPGFEEKQPVLWWDGNLPQAGLLDFTFCFSFSLPLFEKGARTWWVHASGSKRHFYDLFDSILCRDDGNEFHAIGNSKHIGLYGKNYAEAKIIPLKEKFPGGPARIRLCFLDKEKKTVTDARDLLVTPVPLQSLALLRAPDDKEIFVQKLLSGKPVRPEKPRMWLEIQNLSDYILVLHDSRGSHELYPDGLVWVSHQSVRVGVIGPIDKDSHNNDFTLQFRAFKLNKPGLNPLRRDHISNLIAQDSHGSIIIEDSKAVKDIFIRVWNPSSGIFSKNWIGVTTADCQRSVWRDFDVESGDIKTKLSDASISQGYDKEIIDGEFNFKYRIGDTITPDASVEIKN